MSHLTCCETAVRPCSVQLGPAFTFTGAAILLRKQAGGTLSIGQFNRCQKTTAIHNLLLWQRPETVGMLSIA